MVSSFLLFEKLWLCCDSEWENIQNPSRLGENPLSLSYHKSRDNISFFQSGTLSQRKQWWTPPLPLKCFARQPVGWRLSSCADPADPHLVCCEKFIPHFKDSVSFFFSSKLLIEYLNVLSKAKEKSQICFKLQGRDIFVRWCHSEEAFYFYILWFVLFGLYCFNFAFK